MRKAPTIKAPARAAAVRPRVRKNKPKPAAVNVVDRMREIALAVGGWDDLELPERFKNRTPY